MLLAAGCTSVAESKSMITDDALDVLFDQYDPGLDDVAKGYVSQLYAAYTDSEGAAVYPCFGWVPDPRYKENH